MLRTAKMSEKRVEGSVRGDGEEKDVTGKQGAVGAREM